MNTDSSHTPQEENLREAFAAIKEGERRDAADAAAGGGYQSSTLQSASKAVFDIRSFVEGARSAIDRLGTFVANRALLDSRLAVRSLIPFIDSIH